MMAVVSFFVEKHRGIRHIVCRKTVYIRVKLHNYTLYAGIHTYFFVRSVKNAKKNECSFIENDAFKRKNFGF